MNLAKRLEFAGKIARFFGQSNGFANPSRDCCWLVGMFCDTSISDEELIEHIKDTQEKFPEYAHLLNWKNVVYCVYGYSGMEGDDNYYMQKIFAQRADAERYMEERNKGSAYKMIVCIEETEVE